MIERVREREIAGSSLPLLEIPGWRDRFGLVAGVTGRGDPNAPSDFGLQGDAPVRAVIDRWQLLGKAAGNFDGVVVARQVHGKAVLWHSTGSGWMVFEGLDGHATMTPGLLLAVSLADCVPVYLVDPDKKAIALLHSGWRGTAQGILAAGVRELAIRCGSDPASLVAHFGVAICGNCYEVSREVAQSCGEPVEQGSGAVHLDLRQSLANQAAASGITSVSISEFCTSCDHPRFMSHRRSAGADGRMVAFLGFPNVD